MGEKKPKLKIKQDPEEEIPTEIIAKSIVNLSDGFQKLLKGGLRFETVVILLHDVTKISKREIRNILGELPRLKQRFTTKG